VTEALVPLVAAPPERWFDSEIEEDPEVPTGQVVRANSEGGRCVFRKKAGRGCALHALNVKPMVCSLFPLSWDQKVLKPNADLTDGLVCAGGGMTLYEAARDALRAAFGDRLIGELDALSKQA
jgi:Fe-S-cluster containining protein